jgi:hypothetical protein
LPTSSAFAAYATYRYFTSEEEPDVDCIGVPSIAPDEAIRFDMDEHES